MCLSYYDLEDFGCNVADTNFLKWCTVLSGVIIFMCYTFFMLNTVKDAVMA